MKYKCFDCGGTDEIHQHHVVPRSLGGTKTIPLCLLCHAKVHSRKSMSSAILIKKGLAKKIKEGYKLGRPRYGYKFNQDRTKEIPAPKEYEILQKVLCWVEDDSLMYGVYSRLTKYLNDIGVPRRVGGSPTQQSTYKTFKRYIIEAQEKRKNKLMKEVDELLEDK